MLRSLIRRKLNSVEKQLGAPIDYLRFILDTSLPAFFKFSKIIPLAAYRRALPVEPYHLAILVASRDADCGGCVQIGVNMAKRDGVDVALIRAAAEGRYDDLPPDLNLVCRFAESVVRNDGRDAELRPEIVSRYGNEGLVELAMAIASCRVFPTTKRALGYAEGCQLDRLTI